MQQALQPRHALMPDDGQKPMGAVRTRLPTAVTTMLSGSVGPPCSDCPTPRARQALHHPRRGLHSDQDACWSYSACESMARSRRSSLPSISPS